MVVWRVWCTIIGLIVFLLAILITYVLTLGTRTGVLVSAQICAGATRSYCRLRQGLDVMTGGDIE